MPALFKKTGFAEIHRAMRVAAVLCVENAAEVRAWWESLPPQRREAQNPQHIWRCLSAAKRKALPHPRRLRIDEATALRAWEDARLAARDANFSCTTCRP